MTRTSLRGTLFVIVMVAYFVFSIRSCYHQNQELEKIREANRKAFDARMKLSQHEHDLVEKTKTASPAERKRIEAEIVRTNEEILQTMSPEERNRWHADFKAALIAQEKYKKASPAERKRIDAENKRISEENIRYNQKQMEEAFSHVGQGSGE